MAGNISILIGGHSNLVGTYSRSFSREISAKYGEPSDISFKGICVDDHFTGVSFEKIYDLDANGDKDKEISTVHVKENNNKKTKWVDKISPQDVLKFSKIPSVVNDKEKHINIFKYIDYFESQNFIDAVEENIRHHSETLDYVDGFNIYCDAFNRFSFAAPIILNYMDDEFDSKVKVVYGLYDFSKNNQTYRLYQESISSLFSIETLKHSNTVLFPLSHIQEIQSSSEKQVHLCNEWLEFDSRLDFNDVYQRSRFFGYAIQCFERNLRNNKDHNGSFVHPLISDLWGNQGCMLNLMYRLISPIEKDKHIFHIVNNYYEFLQTRQFFAFTPGYFACCPSWKATTYQFMSLNDHPELDLRQIEREISRFSWSDALSRKFHPDNFTKKDMLDLFLQKTYPNTLNESSCLDYSYFHEQNKKRSLYFPSLMSIFAGSTQFTCIYKMLNDLPNVCKRRYPIENSFKYFDFSLNSIKEYKNDCFQILERLDSLAYRKSF